MKISAAIIFIFSFFLLSCKPEQVPTEFNLTRAPQSGESTSFSTKMNADVPIFYEINEDKDATDLKLVMHTPPKNGSLKDCTKTALTISCIYKPNKNFVGYDQILFQAKDGDFLSEETSELSIYVNSYSYVDATKEFRYVSSVNAVCEPLGEQSTIELKKGLVGNLRLIKEAAELELVTTKTRRDVQRNLSNYLDPLLSEAVDDLKVFMSLINIPQRSFLDGFSTQEGSSLEYNGEKLVEFFNVNLYSDLIIETDELAGEYELALGSDDGSKLSVKESHSESFETYLNSDREHSTTFLCSDDNGVTPTYVNFEKGKPVGIEVNYFQGPRTAIALQMFWRKKVNDQAKSSQCGERVNMDLLSKEGWKVIPSRHFYLPDGYINPCVDKTITDKISEITFSENLLVDGVSNLLVTNIKVYVQDEGKGNLIEYKDTFEVTNDLSNNSVNYTIKLNPNNPIIRDIDKKIVIQYQKRID